MTGLAGEIRVVIRALRRARRAGTQLPAPVLATRARERRGTMSGEARRVTPARPGAMPRVQVMPALETTVRT